MLSGQSPWPSEDFDAAIVDEDVDLEQGIFLQVSGEAKDLLILMLEKDPARRIQAREALDHPWFQIKHPTRGKARVVREAHDKLEAVESSEQDAAEMLDDANSNAS
jgi:serine/threonine protein kinase